MTRSGVGNDEGTVFTTNVGDRIIQYSVNKEPLDTQFRVKTTIRMFNMVHVTVIHFLRSPNYYDEAHMNSPEPEAGHEEDMLEGMSKFRKGLCTLHGGI